MLRLSLLGFLFKLQRPSYPSDRCGFVHKNNSHGVVSVGPLSFFREVGNGGRPLVHGFRRAIGRPPLCSQVFSSQQYSGAVYSSQRFVLPAICETVLCWCRFLPGSTINIGLVGSLACLHPSLFDVSIGLGQASGCLGLLNIFGGRLEKMQESVIFPSPSCWSSSSAVWKSAAGG